jgi:hypothetical protein
MVRVESALSALPEWFWLKQTNNVPERNIIMSSTIELPDYSDDIEVIKQQIRDANAVYSGATLYAGIDAMRKGAVKYEANKSGEGFGWKGVAKAATNYDMSKGEISKVVKVVQQHLQSALECEPEDVKSYVLLFVQEHGSVSAAYEKLVPSGQTAKEPVEWSLADACTTLAKKAAKEGYTAEDLNAAFMHAVMSNFAVSASA